MTIETIRRRPQVSHTPSADAAPARAAKAPALDGLGTLAESLRRSLRAENKAPRMIETCDEALRLFGDVLRE